MQDSLDLLTEQVNDGLEEEHNTSDDEQTCMYEKARPAIGGNRAALIDSPTNAEVAPQFGHLGKKMMSSGNTYVAHHLRQTRMTVIKAHASISSKKIDKEANTEPCV